MDKILLLAALLAIMAGFSTKGVAGTASSSVVDYAQHMMNLKQKIPGKDFTIIVEKPFVVVGNEKPQVVKMRTEATVCGAVAGLRGFGMRICFEH